MRAWAKIAIAIKENSSTSIGIMLYEGAQVLDVDNSLTEVFGVLLMGKSVGE